MNIFFDIDGTLTVDHHWQTLRPGTVETFRQLKEKEHLIYLWSRRGNGHCSVLTTRFPELKELVSGVATKPYRRDMAAGRILETIRCTNLRDIKICLETRPHSCVDNSGLHLLAAYGGILVPTYKDPEDTSTKVMDKVLDVILQNEPLVPYVDLKGCI